MKKQPEALRLSDALEHQVYRGSYDWERVEPMMLEAAAELRRLQAERDELLEALKYHQEQTRPIQKSIDAIAKVTGQ